MLKDSRAFGGFSVDDLEAAKEFYGETLGLEVSENDQGLMVSLLGSNGVFIYEKEDHVPASFTILNFLVDDIDAAVDELAAAGIVFEHYDGTTDDKGIARVGRRSRSTGAPPGEPGPRAKRPPTGCRTSRGADRGYQRVAGPGRGDHARRSAR